MNPDEKYDFFEKLYFHENDVKEKLHARVQGVFAYYAVIATAITYVFKNIEYAFDMISLLIVGLLLASCFFIVLGLLRLKKAFWGNKFARIQTPNELLKYEKELTESLRGTLRYNFEYPNNIQPVFIVKEKMKECLIDSYGMAASCNMLVNAERSERIHESVHKMFLSLIPLTMAMLLFLAFNKDTSAPRNTHGGTKVIIVHQSIFSI